MRRILFLMILLLAWGSTTMTAQQRRTGGRASYYSNRLHGRRMSNGERYHRDSMTCAHRTLPFGTHIRVTNPQNGRSVVVEVTDRGPFSRSRVIDLSYAAARKLGILARGVAYIRMEILPKETEIPYMPDAESFGPGEVVYGMAGVAYEFIPEWEKNADDDKPQQIQRKPAPRTRKEARQQVHQRKAQTSVKKNHQNNNRKVVQKKAPQNHKSTAKKEEGGWKGFFNKVKNGITSLFD